MTTLTVQVISTGLQSALKLIDRIGDAPRSQLMDGIGRLVQGQMRRRIESEKTSPDGEAWKPNWKGSSILYDSGALADSIDYASSENSVEVGSGLVYARIHNDGGKIVAKDADALSFMMGNKFVQVKSVTMPRRQFAGLSADNESEILDTTRQWLARLLQ